MNRFLSTILKSVFILLLITFSVCRLSAQTNSRVAVIATETNTKIWVSDFPKNSTVLLVDADKNLVSIVSTNDSGIAFLSLNKCIKTIIARTMNGDILVSNEIFQKEAEDSQTAFAKTNSLSVRA